jgi:hypothetical protein
MRIAVLTSLALALFALDARVPALASPWCSTYGGMSCGYDTFEQCLVSIRGVGGSCIRNTMEPEIAVQPAPVVAQPAPAPRVEKKKPPKKPVASVAPNPSPSAPPNTSPWPQ